MDNTQHHQQPNKELNGMQNVLLKLPEQLQEDEDNVDALNEGGDRYEEREPTEGMTFLTLRNIDGSRPLLLREVRVWIWLLFVQYPPPRRLGRRRGDLKWGPASHAGPRRSSHWSRSGGGAVKKIFLFSFPFGLSLAFCLRGVTTGKSSCENERFPGELDDGPAGTRPGGSH